MASGCPARTVTGPSLSWKFEARATGGEIKVLPVLALHDEPEVNLRAYVGGDVPPGREEVRIERTEQLARIPGEVAWALPGAVNGALGSSWTGEFRVGRYPLGAQERLRLALGRGSPPDRLLGEVARSVGGQGSLITWVDHLSGAPLSEGAFPGQRVESPRGPLIIDHGDEPYRVVASVGMALVASDGEVVLRYHDTYETVLSAHYTPERAASDLASRLAAEVLKVWATPGDLAPKKGRVVTRG